jgi:hypothetical protein
MEGLFGRQIQARPCPQISVRFESEWINCGSNRSLEGRRHDCGMLRENGLLSRLERIRNMMGSSYIYGDPAYPISDVIKAPYKGACLSEV